MNSLIQNRIALAVGLILLLGAARFPWLEADAGSRGMFAFGYFNTDEGAYTSGGRLMFLEGKFFDPRLNDGADAPGFWGMNLLAYGGYLMLGLSYGAARLPVMIFSVTAWTMVFLYCSRKTMPFFAWLMVATVSMNPVSLTYERTASTDIAAGSLFIISMLLLIRRSIWKSIVAGLLLGYALSVKRTVLGLFPLTVFILFVYQVGFKKSLFFIGSLVATSLFMWITWKVHINRVLQAEHFLNSQILWHKPWVDEMFGNIRESGKALWLFPRLPLNTQAGVLLIFTVITSVLMVVRSRSLCQKWISRKSMWALGALIFCLEFAVQIKSPVRYWLPVFYLLPILLVEFRGVSKYFSDTLTVRRVVGIGGIILMIYWFTVPGSIQTVWRPFDELSLCRNEYAMLTEIPWLSGILIRGLVVALFYFLLCERFKGAPPLKRIGLRGMIAVALTCLLMANFDALITRTAIFHIPDHWFHQFLLISIILFVFCTPYARRWFVLVSFVLIIFLATGFLNTHWSSSYGQLFHRTYQVRQTADELAASLPENAIVIGRRADTLLRHTPLRLGLTSTDYPDALFSAQLRSLLAVPGTTIYWLVDSDNTSYEVEKYWSVLEVFVTRSLFKTIELPGDTTAAVKPVYIYKLVGK